MNDNEEKKNESVEQALDDIFGSSFIEVNANNKIDNNTSNDDIYEESNYENQDDYEQPYNSFVFPSVDSINVKDEVNVNEINDDLEETIQLSKVDAVNPIINNIVNEDETEDEKLTQTILNIPRVDEYNTEVPLVSEEEKNRDTINSKKVKKKDKIDKGINDKEDICNKKFDVKKAIIFGVTFVLIIIIIYLIFNHVNNTVKNINCSYSAEDTGYNITDEYKITYKKNSITYVEGNYKYEAKTEEFKSQIPIIKAEKLPIIINSNGMPGFTYTYELSDTYFKVASYLDFTLFNYDQIDKVNYDLAPISYITINSKTTLDSLKKNLEDKGYKCINTN